MWGEISIFDDSQVLSWKPKKKMTECMHACVLHVKWLVLVRSSETYADKFLLPHCVFTAVLVGRFSSGKVWAISAKNSATGTEMFGGRVDEGANTLKDPQWGTEYSLTNGDVVGKWCPSPPIIGGLIGSIFPRQGVWVPQVREQGGFIEVLVDVNAKAEFEKKYWKGILDAQGKADGGYY